MNQVFMPDPDRIKHEIPEGWRICGENLYARHSILYDGLKSYLYVFSVWNERNECLSWDETVEWCELLGLECADVLYRGLFDESVLKRLADELDVDKKEVYVFECFKLCRRSRYFLCGDPRDFRIFPRSCNSGDDLVCYQV